MTAEHPILVFGGPYSNLQATAAVLAEAARRYIPRERVICTGDVVAYGADAKACLELVRNSGIGVVMGNCEQQLAAGASDCGCGFSPGSDCDRLSAAWFSHARAQLDPDDCRWMGSLPRRLDVEVSGLRLVAIHASLLDISRFVFASTPARIKDFDLGSSGADGIIAGHSGLPFSQVIDGRLWHNPGAIGMPANDGTPRVWYSVITPGETRRSISIEHASLDYDHHGAVASMRRAGLPEGYTSALLSGLWPSCEVLPAEEARSTGAPLAARTLTWDGESDGPAWPIAPEAEPPRSRQIPRPEDHSGRRGEGQRRIGKADNALDQYRHAVQPLLRELLYRIDPEERPARLHNGGRGVRISGRNRPRRVADEADRLYRRRAVHEPGPSGNARRCTLARP